jgi:hypothetical protein
VIQLDHAEVIWALNSYCTLQCEYCRPEWRSGKLDHTIDEYLAIVKKLQRTRYQHHSHIHWRLTGGEPLNFPELSTLLKKIKEKPATVELETSGEIEWFSFTRISRLVDRVHLTYHWWQNEDVSGFIFEQCQENNVPVTITVPLAPGEIHESRARVEHFQSLGYECKEQTLTEADGRLYRGYSQVDQNRIFGRPDDWKPTPIKIDPNLPAPGYVDLRIVTNVKYVYTGKPCYAGVDWIYINHKGFVSYSQCGGRDESLNVFNPEWEAPGDHFPCTVNQCRSVQDRSKIRIIGAEE